VLTANVENLPRTSDALCPGEFRDLYAYLQVEGLRPDVLFVQQLSGQAQLDEVLALLNARLGRAYAGRVAEADPASFASQCGAPKERQTNAVVFATDRLQVVDEPLGAAVVQERRRELRPQHAVAQLHDRAAAARHGHR
jgi:hypothetical protein